MGKNPGKPRPARRSRSTGPVINPFQGAALAERYARSRPGLHTRVIERLAQLLPAPDRALDLACGTGLSAAPLAWWANVTVGVDVSVDMLSLARRVPASLVEANAGALPFRTATFDFATIASAIHWFDPARLGELRRVLRTGGSLAVYDVWFPGEMTEVPGFAEWLTEVAGARYPKIPRNDQNLEALADEGFDRDLHENFRESVELTLSGLVDYLMTHSERLGAVRSGAETEEGQREFLTASLRPFFEPEVTRAVVFGIELELFQAT